METFTSRNENSKQDMNREVYNKSASIVNSKLKQFRISHEKTDFDKRVEGKPPVDKKVISNTVNKRLVKYGLVTLPSSAKTPKPPEVPKSATFCGKGTPSRLGGDGEACKEEVEDEQIDYCCMERLPGDGCISECNEDDDIDNLSDGFYEDDLLEEGIDDIHDESCSEEFSQHSSSGESRPSTATSRISSAPSATLRREKLVKSLNGKISRSSLKSADIGSSKGRWIACGTEEIRSPLTPSLFPNKPSTIHFTVDGERVHSFPLKIKKLLKWKMSTITPNVVKLCIARSGFRPTKKSDWLGYWGKHMKAAAFKSVREHQKVNHFPGSFQIGRKDKLWKNLSKLQTRHGKKEFGFIPQTFVLPHDFRNLKRVWEEVGSRQKWILKPPASARGIGIRVVHKWTQIPKKRPVIVQKYLSKPYLINGRKFDLRIYVFISSFDPLRIYLFEDGLTRFATCKYSSSSKSLSNRFMHLTNYSINKKNEDVYTPNNDEDACQGHKWSLKALWGYLKRMGVNTTRIWEGIKDIVVKTIISCESTVNLLMKQNVRDSYSCNELFGFDIMLDENLKPWILEVNISPSLHSTSPLDMSIKGQMVRDLLNISGYRIPENGASNSASNSSGGASSLDKGRLVLTSDQKAKHGFYVNHQGNERVRMTILDILTPEDMKILMETEDEYSRRGCFQRIFPSENSQKYLKYFEAPRSRYNGP
ncbi:tubulin polyglutamylase TTLL4-like isoform X2 [Dendronephthya gigantea]|uniref:tubulin polyglutamylase TTLL4-like isoform X2 n=1 Tax=Dendronephthya gigantea TaxID=151771 RepID=UPI001069ECA6|nr:tubulin polyglutamylase TTLL4-like isoform X2 [Dendronephthya gigantea]